MRCNSTVPDLGHLSDQYAVLLLGRKVAEDPRVGMLRQLDARLSEWKRAHLNPVALVPTTGWRDWSGTNTMVRSQVFVGVVVALAAPNHGVTLQTSHLASTRRVPAGLWPALKRFLSDDSSTQDELWLVPTGWARAVLSSTADRRSTTYRDSRLLLLGAPHSVDREPFMRLDPEALALSGGRCQLSCLTR